MSEVQAIQNPTQLILCQEALFAGAVGSNPVKWEQEKQFAIQQVTKTKFAADTAMSNQISLQNAIINVAAIGISLNPAHKHAYLVPRDGGICLDVSYMGLIHLALSSGAVVSAEAKLVYESDHYQNNGIGQKPTHISNTFAKDKGDIVGAYCVALRVVAGAEYWMVEEMDRAALDKIRDSSKAKNGPWKTWPEEMMRKTVVKRASKYWQCADVDRAVEVLHQTEGLVVNEAPCDFSSYDQKNKSYLDKCMADSNAVGMALMAASVTQEELESLGKSFPQGDKGRCRAVMNELIASGNDYLLSYVTTFDSCAGDDLAVKQHLIEIREHCGQLESRALDAILSRCASETEMYVRGLING